MVDHGCMRAYSEDLRTKIVEAVERGMPKAQASHLFGVSVSSVKRYVRLARQGLSLAPRQGGGRPPKADKLQGSSSKRTSRSVRQPP
jgi:transposase